MPKKSISRLQVGGDISAAEAIDRLFGIAHEEQGALTELERCPVTGIRVCRQVAAETPEYLGLQRIRVLKLIDENVGVAGRQRPAHLVVIAQQIARGEYQVVEIEKGGRPLMLAEVLHNRPHELDQIGEDA